MSYVVYEGLSTPNEVLEKMSDYITRKGYTIVQDLTDDSNIYDRSSNDGKKIYMHEHIKWCSPFLLNRMRSSFHFYFDETFIRPNQFEQLPVVMYLDTNSMKKIPWSIHSSKFKGYIII